MRLTFSLELAPSEPARRRFAATASLIIAGLIAVASFGGILGPTTYVHETPSWRIQGLAQDWVDLLVAVPWLVATAILVRRGSRRARLLQAGGLVYAAYSFAIYAFAVHFNALFLVYCAVFGLSGYALFALGADLAADDVRAWFDVRAPRRAIGGFEMASAVVFALLWLAQIVPAMLAGTSPTGLDEVGLPTNPVHVLDLAVVLPGMFVAGWLLWRGSPGGYVLAPILLGFAVLMDLNLIGIAIALHVAGLAAQLAIIYVFTALTLAAGVLLVLMLRSVHHALPTHATAVFETL